jgi:hypothetical protein
MEVTWTVRANFGSTTTGYAEAQTFRLAEYDNDQNRPIILSPQSGSVQPPPEVTFVWEPVVGATGYEVHRYWCPQPDDNCRTTSRVTVSGSTTGFGVACDPERPYVNFRLQSLYTLTNTRSWYNGGVDNVLCADPTPTPTSSPTPFLLQMITLAPSATPTPTPFLLQMITLGPTHTPTATFTPTPSASPIPVVTAAGGVTGLELLTPADGAFLAQQPVLLSWTEERDAPIYRVELTRCDAATGVCTNEQIQSATTSVPYSVSVSSNVTWRVQAVRSSGQATDFTPPWSFSVTLPTPIPLATAVFGLTGLEPLRPVHNAIVGAQPVLLTWTAQPDSPRYELEITVCDAVNDACITEQVVVTRASYALPLAGNALVNWRVRPLLASGRTTEFTALQTFEYDFGYVAPTPSPTVAASRNG